MTSVALASPANADTPFDAASARLVDSLRRCAAGDETALRTLYDATSAHLLGVAFDILRHRGRAEEVLQDAYLRVWQCAGSYDALQSRPMTWLIHIVRHRAIDVLRAQRAEQARTVPLDAEHDDKVVDFAPRPEQLLQRALAARRIESCLGSLGREQRQAVALVIYRGLSHAEIAQQAGVPLSTAKAWVRRGFQRLMNAVDASDAPGLARCRLGG